MELLAMVKAKASSFLEQPKERGKESLPKCSLHLFEEEKKMRMTSSKGGMATASKGEKVRALSSPWEDSGLIVWNLIFKD